MMADTVLYKRHRVIGALRMYDVFWFGIAERHAECSLRQSDTERVCGFAEP